MIIFSFTCLFKNVASIVIKLSQPKRFSSNESITFKTITSSGKHFLVMVKKKLIYHATFVKIYYLKKKKHILMQFFIPFIDCFVFYKIKNFDLLHCTINSHAVRGIKLIFSIFLHQFNIFSISLKYNVFNVHKM